jgi:hypothetical protein
MARADSKPTSVTWTPLCAAHPLIVKICLSPSEAGPWLVKQIAAERVRVRWRDVRPADPAVKDFWQGSPPTIDFADCSVTKLVVAPPGTVVGLCPVILLGVEVVREDLVEAQRPAFPSAIESVTPEPVAMTAEQKRRWLRTAKRARPRRPGETHRKWAEDMVTLQKTVCTNVWPVVTMERRLRDKDPDE